MKIPENIAIIMDGNGRWAQKDNKPRTAGHLAGSENIRTIALYANQIGVKQLILYAFSTENWARPEEEKNYLFKLPALFFSKYIAELKRNNIRVSYIGEIEKFPENTANVIRNAVKETAMNTGLNLCLAVNYGARKEIALMCTKIAQDYKNGIIDAIDEKMMSSYLMEPFDIDLLIRTSGEQRLSNFLLWQVAYAEMVFVDEHWPDFTEQSLDKCIETFNHRHRRFGGI